MWGRFFTTTACRLFSDTTGVTPVCLNTTRQAFIPADMLTWRIGKVEALLTTLAMFYSVGHDSVTVDQRAQHQEYQKLEQLNGTHPSFILRFKSVPTVRSQNVCCWTDLHRKHLITTKLSEPIILSQSTKCPLKKTSVFQPETETNNYITVSQKDVTWARPVNNTFVEMCCAHVTYFQWKVHVGEDVSIVTRGLRC